MYVTLRREIEVKEITLGRGGFGDVVKITRPDGLVVARKTLRLNPLEDNSKLIRRFKREVSYQKKLHSKNIVPILYSDLDSEPPFFDMPLATCDLGRELKSAKELGVNLKIYIFLCALSGVEHIHMRQQLHRDIKPENLLRFDYPDGSYIYKLSDLGLISPAKGSVTTNITGAGGGFGTDQFLAREVYLRGFEAATVQSDIYSLGVLLFYLFGSKEEINSSLPYSTRQTSHLMGNVISKCTADAPSHRYENIAALRSDFILFAARLLGV